MSLAVAVAGLLGFPAARPACSAACWATQLNIFSLKGLQRFRLVGAACLYMDHAFSTLLISSSASAHGDGRHAVVWRTGRQIGAIVKLAVVFELAYTTTPPPHHTHPLHPAGSIVVRQRSWRSLEDQDISNDIHWHFYAVGSGGGHISATEMASRELYRSKISEALSLRQDYFAERCCNSLPSAAASSR
ncbi:hypothetical protein CFE70_001590 [Pyrenophora teres f. teres 0-1]